MTTNALGDLQRALGHVFADPGLIEQALVHRSYLAETSTADSFERMEFLGDAVLQLAVTHHLYVEYPEMPEGELAKIRAAVVNENSLASVARTLGVPPALALGRGEELTGGRDKSSILSDAMEAILGALYLDAGFEPAAEIIVEHWSKSIAERAKAPGRRDYKTRLQELLARDNQTPRYEVTDTGPEHAKTFSAIVLVDDRVLGSGEGSSKKQAEQEAARAAFEAFGA